MRVLYVSDNRSDHNRRFLEKLSAAGHELWFLDITNLADGSGWLPANVKIAPWSTVFPRNGDPSQIIKLVPEFQKLVKVLKPDLVHAGPIQSSAYLVALAGFHPLLVMSWGSDILVNACQNMVWEQATRIALSEADGLLCDCDTVRSALGEFSRLGDERIAQFPWGVKRGSFGPNGTRQATADFATETFRVISTRSWEPLYDVEILLMAFHAAHAQEARMRLLLLGDGSLRTRIRSLIAELGLGELVLTPGQVAASDLPRWFRSANVYASCAKSDGTSISLLEAMATGLPVVVTQNPSNEEWVECGQNGWLAESGNVAAFAEGLLNASRLSDAQRDAISSRNQELVSTLADWDKNFPQLLGLYSQLCLTGRIVK